MDLTKTDPGAVPRAVPVESILQPLPYEKDRIWTGAVIPEQVTRNSIGSTIANALEIVRLPDSGNFSAGGGATLHPNGNEKSVYKFDWRFPGQQHNTDYASPRGWFVQFNVSNTRDIEFLVYANTAGFSTARAAWNLVLDGQLVWDYGRDSPVTMNAFNLIKFTLPDTGQHNVRFYMNALSLRSVFAESSAAASDIPLKRDRAVFIGDSLTTGTLQTRAVEAGSWIWRFGLMTGLDDVWNGGIGATGFVADRSGMSANYVTRAATDVTPADPKIVFITSYFNDRTTPAPDVGAAAGQALDIIGALPSKPRIIVTGTYDPWGLNTMDFLRRDDAIKAECFNRGVPYIQPTNGVVYGGNGNPIGDSSGPWVTEANRYKVIGEDNLNQNDLGQKYFAYQMCAAYDKLSQP